jgi:pyruvate formate lyase activating enzyme
MGTTLQEQIDAFAVPGELVRPGDGDEVRCVACGHRCLVRPGRRGVCRVRFNRAGTLMVPRGYTVGVASDPVEKKPFYHLLPGQDCLTFGMLGCDFHCSYCQNWLTSQALRDPAAAIPPTPTSAGALVSAAVRHRARIVASSYNEPLITAEWAAEVFRGARGAGLRTAVVSNGNATPEALDYLRPTTDAYKIDLKAMQDRSYRQLGGVLQHVLDAIRMVHERGFWMEIVTLVVPGFNDDPGELRAMAAYLAGVSADIPWHVTAFHQNYRMTDPRNTTVHDLLRAAEIGRDAGLRYVYAGNLPGRVGRWEHTWCPTCEAQLVERFGYRVLQYRITDEGCCPDCGTRIPGLWS